MGLKGHTERGEGVEQSRNGRLFQMVWAAEKSDGTFLSEYLKLEGDVSLRSAVCKPGYDKEGD